MNLPLYKQIYESIYKKIQNGELKQGERIPSEKDLADQFKVSRITSKNALDLLAKRNIIERIQGKGSFVKNTSLNGANETNATEQSGQEIRSVKIGLIIPGFSDSYGTELLMSIEEYARQYQADLLIKINHEMIENETKAIQELLDAGVVGIIILPIHGKHYNKKILELVLQGYPIILVDRYLKGILANSISTDNLKAAEEATDYLFSLGHQNIAYITHPYDGTTVLEDRMKGFQQAYSTRNKILNPHHIIISHLSEYAYDPSKKNEFQKELKKIKQFIIDHPQVSAFLTARHAFAEILEHVIHSINKSVPKDYSIICFDSPYYIFNEPKFTHIKQNEKELGKRAVEVLMDQINGKAANTVTETTDFSLVKGCSTSGPDNRFKL